MYILYVCGFIFQIYLSKFFIIWIFFLGNILLYDVNYSFECFIMECLLCEELRNIVYILVLIM